jgi:hypothetical protein
MASEFLLRRLRNECHKADRADEDRGGSGRRLVSFKVAAVSGSTRPKSCAGAEEAALEPNVPGAPWRDFGDSKQLGKLRHNYYTSTTGPSLDERLYLV